MYRKSLKMVGVTLTDFMRNNCPYISAGIAFWTLFSLFPLGLAWIAVLGFVYPTVEKQSEVVAGIINLIPVSAEYLSDTVSEVADARGAIGGLAVVGLVWAGTAVFSAIRKGINHAWHIRQPHYFLLERAIDFVMLLAVTALASIQVMLTTNLLGLATLTGRASTSGFSMILDVLVELFVLGATIGAFILLYRYVPNTLVRWKDVWIGAVIGAILFQVVRSLFEWFLSNFGNLNLVYGSLSALMAVLVWAYLSALTIMIGAQFGYTYRGVYGSRAGDVELPNTSLKSRITSRFGKRRSLARTLLDTVIPRLLPNTRK